MTAIPWDLLGVPAGERKHTGVGMAFLPQDPLRAKEAMQVIEGAWIGDRQARAFHVLCCAMCVW